jgi:formiminoglutamase/agmatinase
MIQARGRYAVIGFPWDFGASLGRPGSRYTPKAIREALGRFLRRIVDGKIFAVEEGEVIDSLRDTYRGYRGPRDLRPRCVENL